MTSPRDKALQELADNIRALTRGMSSATTVLRRRTTGHVEHHTHRVTHPGLLHQLVAALTPGAATSDTNGGGGRKPGYRQPSAAAASATLQLIEEEAGWLLRDLRHTAGSLGPRGRTLTDALQEIPALVLRTGPDSDYPRAAAAATSRWVTQARTTLAHDAPVATLRDLPCPYCQERLKVRSDASSDVWCPNPACRDEEGQRYRWAVEEWPFLLERMTRRRDGAA